MSVREVGGPVLTPPGCAQQAWPRRYKTKSHWGQRGHVAGPQHPCGGSVEAPEQEGGGRGLGR